MADMEEDFSNPLAGRPDLLLGSGSSDEECEDFPSSRSPRSSFMSGGSVGRLSFMSVGSRTAESMSAVLEVEQAMVDLLQSAETTGGPPAANDRRFIEEVYGRVAPGEASFSAEQLQGFMLETLGLQTDWRGVEQIVREMVRYPTMASEVDEDRGAGDGGGIRVTQQSFRAWWDETALTASSVSEMSSADDLRRGLRLLGLFGAARDALLSNLPAAGEEVGSGQVGEGEDGADGELRELFSRCNTRHTKHLQIRDIAAVALDLGLLLTTEQLKAVLRELDMSHSNRVGFVEFKSWWEADAERTWFDSASLRRRLRLCGLLMNTSRSVLDVFQLGMDISDDDHLAQLVDGALDMVLQKGTRKQVVDLLHDGVDPEADQGGELQGLALGVLPPSSAVRKLAYQLTSTEQRGDLGWWFEGAMTLLIVFNLFVLIAHGGESGTMSAEQRERAELINLVVGVIFTFEAALEIIARGFWLESRRTYLREDGANVFDFLIVVTMWLLYALPDEWVPGHISFAVVAMRGFHVLKYFEGVKEIIGSILHGSQALWLVTELMLLSFIIFAMLGRELFGGSGSITCTPVSNDSSDTAVCPLNFDCYPCYEIASLAGPRLRPQHYDKFGFDSFSVATVSVFSAASLDEWATIAQPVRAGDSEMSSLVWPFFMILVLLLNLVGVNLFLAGVTFSYMTVRQAKHAHDAMHKAYEMLVKTLVRQEKRNTPNDLAADVSTFENDLAADASTFEKDEGDSPRRKSGPHKIMEMKGFDLGITIAVMINIGCLAVVHHDMDPGLANLLEVLDYVFTSIYVFEACVKITAMGFRPYWQVKMNRLDFIICASALVGYVISFLNVDLASIRIVRIMRIARAARALRVGKVVLKFERTKHMLSMAFGHIDAAISLLFLICFWILVFGIVAMFLFSTCPTSGRVNRAGFKDFWSASMTNFQILSGDDWAWVMYEYMDCYQTPELVAVYFVAMHMSSAFIMVNLFVAIFLENFALSDEDKRQKQIDVYIQKNVIEHEDEPISLTEIKAVGMLVDAIYSGSTLLKRVPFQGFQGIIPVSRQRSESLLDVEASSFEAEPALPDAKAYGETYLCGTTDSAFRRVLQRIVEPKEGTNWFHRFIELSIVLSGCAIAVEGPTGAGSLGCLGGLEDLDSDGQVDPWLPRLLTIADYTFYFIFLTECVFMITAFGLYSNEHAYLRTHRAHWFDLFVVLVTSIDLVLQLTMTSDSTGMKIIRLLRVLRLLRLLEEIPAMALMAEAIEHSMLAVSGLVGLLIGSVAMFGIVGVSLFMGMFFHCAPEATVSVSYHSNITILQLDKEACLEQGFVWQNLFFTFDSLPDALSTLFICMTRQGWMELFYAAVDTTDHASAPLMEDNYLSATIFFVLFVMINAFLLEQLFVGILVDVFSQSSGHALLTADQKNWQYVQMCVAHFASKSKVLPATPVAVRCQDLMHAAKVQIFGHRIPAFKFVVNTVIVANVVSLVLNPAMNPGERSDAAVSYDYFNLACLVLYTVEVGIKSTAYSFRQYVSTDQMDFMVVVVMWPVAIHAYLQHSQPETFAHNPSTDWIQALQIVRLFRAFDLINSSNRLRKLVQTIRLSVPHVKNLGMLMFLTYSVFAVCAMKLLGTIQLDHPENKVISEWANFGDFWNAFMLLFQVTTGQPLPALILDSACSPRLGEAPLDCIGGSGEIFTVMLFVSTFYIISNFVFLNLFIALLLENFEYNWSSDFTVDETDVNGFREKWLAATDSRDESTPIPLREVRAFVEDLKGTFQVLVRADPFWFNRLLLELDLTPVDVVADQQRGEEIAAAVAANMITSFDLSDAEPVEATDAGGDPRHMIQFHELLLALSRMRFGNRCLEFDKEVEREHDIQEKHEADAYRILAICVRAWLSRRNPPANFVTESDHRRWRSAVGVARLWMMKSAIRTIRISNQRTWQHRQIDDVISEAMRKRRAEELADANAKHRGTSKSRSRSSEREATKNGSDGAQAGNGASLDGENDTPNGGALGIDDGLTRERQVTFG